MTDTTTKPSQKIRDAITDYARKADLTISDEIIDARCAVDRAVADAIDAIHARLPSATPLHAEPAKIIITNPSQMSAEALDSGALAEEVSAPAKPLVGTEHFPTPEGYVRTGETRPLREGDWYMMLHGERGKPCRADDEDSAIREILRKLPEPPNEPGRTIEQMAREAAENSGVVIDTVKTPNISAEMDFHGFLVFFVYPGNAYVFRNSVAKFASSVAADAIRKLVKRAGDRAMSHPASYKPFVTPDELRSIAADMGVTL